MLSLACKFQSLESDREIIPVLNVRAPTHEPYNGQKLWWFGEESPSSESSWPYHHQIRLSDSLILEKTGSNITIQYEAFTTTFLGISLGLLWFQEKTQNFCVS